MRKTLLALALAGLLAGCGSGSADAPATTAAREDAPAEGYFAASPEAIDAAFVERGPGQTIDGIETKATSTVAVAALGRILGAGTFERLFRTIEETLAPCSGRPCALFRIPNTVRDRLAKEIVADEVGAAWAATQELELAGVDAAEATRVVGELHDLAAAARKANESLWAWWSF